MISPCTTCTFHCQIIGRLISGRNRKTTRQRPIRPKHSDNRGSPAADGAVSGYLSGQTHVSLGAWQRKLSVEPIRLKAWRRSADFDQMPKDPLELFGILNNRNDFHLSTALRTHERVNVGHFRQEPCPGTFARVDVDLFLAF